MGKSYKDKVAAIPFLQEKLWKLAETKANKGRKSKSFDRALKVYNEMVVARRKPRRVFDKKLLCFKVNKGTAEAPDWDFTITEEMIKKEAPKRDVLFRTVKHITDNKNKCETYADVLKLRCDWLIPDSEGNWGTDKSIELSIGVCKVNLKDIDDELEALGFERMNFADNLVEENRTGADTDNLVDKLSGLGVLKRKGEQLNLFDEDK